MTMLASATASAQRVQSLRQRFTKAAATWQQPMVVAVDGPSASGKSSTAKQVAAHMGLLYIDTGAMYRAITWKALEKGLDVHDPSQATQNALVELTRNTNIALSSTVVARDHGAPLLTTRVTIDDGLDITDAIRTPHVTRHIAPVAANPGVRELLVQKQRTFGDMPKGHVAGGVILDGRDIGTVVFPKAPVKFFLQADASCRAQRRFDELTPDQQQATNVQEVEQALVLRDAKDRGRAHGALRQADDAILMDTSHMTLEEQAIGIMEEMCRVVENQ